MRRKKLILFVQLLISFLLISCSLSSTQPPINNIIISQQPGEKAVISTKVNQMKTISECILPEPIYQFILQESILTTINSENIYKINLDNGAIIKKLPLPFKGIKNETRRYHLCIDKNEAYYDLDVKEGKAPVVACIDLDTAKLKYLIQNSYCERYQFYENFIYQQVDPGTETVFCYERNTGKRLWEYFMGVDLSPTFEANKDCYSFSINKIDKNKARVYIINPSNGRLYKKSDIAKINDDIPYPELDIKIFNSSFIVSGDITDHENFLSYSSLSHDFTKNWGKHYSQILDYQIESNNLFLLAKEDINYSLIKLDPTTGDELFNLPFVVNNFIPDHLENTSESDNIFVISSNDLTPTTTKISRFSKDNLTKNWETDIENFSKIWIFKKNVIVAKNDDQNKELVLNFYDQNSGLISREWKHKSFEENLVNDIDQEENLLRIIQRNDREVLVILLNGEINDLSTIDK